MVQPDLMDKVVALAKRRGFIFQSSEIYGGLNGVFDYGPLGVELKRNIKNAWWQTIVHFRDDVVGLDSGILMHAMVWKASGHADSFSDPFVKCPACSKFFRLDKVYDEIKDSPWFQSLRKNQGKSKDSQYLIKWAEGVGKSLSPNLALVKEPQTTLSFMRNAGFNFDNIDTDFPN